MTTITPQPAAVARSWLIHSPAPGWQRIDLLGAAALLVSVLALLAAVLVLKPGATPSDSRTPLDVSTRTHDDWALDATAPRALDVSPRAHDDWMFTASAQPVVVTLAFPDSDGGTGTLVCQSSKVAEGISDDILAFPSEALARAVYAHLCAGASQA
ncbi:MAG: hypothetical protein JO023_13190 [Chloroflexi bacterium]|nr:hypothetical protein [Chloroflexota bacterium]